MALSIIAQAVNAVSAPCPMLEAAMSNAGHKHMMDRSEQHGSNHDMSAMVHTSHTNSAPMADTPTNMVNCCGDESCPMNSYVTGFSFTQPALSYTTTISLIKNTERVHLYLSLSPTSLYRPPIFA